MSDDEFDKLRSSVEARQGDELAVIAPSRVEQPPTIEVAPQAEDEPTGEMSLPETPNPTLEIPTVAGATFDPLETAGDTPVENEILESSPAPAAGEERLAPAVAPTAEPSDLASPEQPQAPNQERLEIPVWDAESVLGAERDRRFVEPTLETSSVTEERQSPLDTPRHARSSEKELLTGYVPLEPGRTDYWVHPAAMNPPGVDMPDELSQQVMTGFGSVRERLMEAMEHQLQEQAILATMRETDF